MVGAIQSATNSARIEHNVILALLAVARRVLESTGHYAYLNFPAASISAVNAV
jgi:hypothetical protein